ncbi:MAG: hypothetical protein AAF368_02150 [Planctomycetota bacterium]
MIPTAFRPVFPAGRSSVAQGGPSPQDAREVAQEILSRSEYRREETVLESLRSKVMDWFKEVFGGLIEGVFGEASANWNVVMGIVATVLLVVALALVLHLIFSNRLPGRSGREVTLSEAARARANELRLEARAAREAGDLLLALRLSFFALVVGLGERGDLRYRAGWTNRELLERGEPTPEVAAALSPLVGELDAMSFGDAVVEEEDVDRFEGLCDRWLGGAVQA